MDYQVVYFSKSSCQNTKRIAEEMAGALGITAKRVTPDMKMPDCKLLFIGSGVYMWRVGKDLRSFIEKFPQSEGQKIAIFITHGGNQDKALVELREKLEEKGCVIIGEWDCLGQWALFKRGHPTVEEVQSAGEFALEMAKKSESMTGVETGELETRETTTISPSQNRL